LNDESVGALLNGLLNAEKHTDRQIVASFKSHMGGEHNKTMLKPKYIVFMQVNGTDRQTHRQTAALL